MEDNTLTKKQEEIANGLSVWTKFSTEDIKTLKATVFQELKTESQFKMALMLANKYDLDPFAKEIWWWVDDKDRLTIVASASWIAKIMRRQLWFKQLISQAVYPSDDFEIDVLENKIKHNIKPKSRKQGENPVWAYSVLRLEWKPDQIQWIYWDEYAPKELKSYSAWGKQKSAMIQKCAITVLWRQAVWLSWLYWEEELDNIRNQNKPEIIDVEPLWDTVIDWINSSKDIKKLESYGWLVRENKLYFEAYAKKMAEFRGIENSQKEEKAKHIETPEEKKKVKNTKKPVKGKISKTNPADKLKGTLKNINKEVWIT